MRITFALVLAIPLLQLACDSTGADTKKADGKAKVDAKAKAGDTKSTKADVAKATDTKAPDTKAADTKAADTKAADAKAPDAKADDTKAADTKAAEPTTPRPADVPADWQAVTGDVWSFWVPKDWKVEDYKPGDGGTGDKGDKTAAAQRVEGGMAISSLECTVRSDLGLPTSAADLEKAVLKRAKDGAKKHEAKSAKVDVDHGGKMQSAITIEYSASGDGTQVMERWAVSTRAVGLSCSDAAGSGAKPEDKKILEQALASFRWTAAP